MAPLEAFETIRLELDGRTALLTLNRPGVRNAVNDAMRHELIAALSTISADDRIGSLILTGADKAFCAGGDIAVMRQRLEVPADELAFDGWKQQQLTYRVLDALQGLHKPVIAAVNGAAAGVGCDLAMCCDFIVASQAAAFSMSFVQRGLVPDAGMYFLPRRVGLPRAKELIYSGRRVTAEEAMAIGLADRIVPSEILLNACLAWSEELASQPAPALAFAKSLLDASLDLSVDEVLARSRQAQALCFTTAEHRRSVSDFLAKRK
ncbi:enoyl-CoA hydratase [Bordetella genomosp. 10]|uniref:Enoyl-CoA hydratase n=1 Tax=Bordetella genomosp. 10 TaxID=1416804 RepID=A0A261S2K3_9BORD|nr:enoyl-CoA hydratase/isomerase family protein [Bordetella genomosp. 10]OZI31162.1 enoyl-CoA hydratase [Bordetella genomosp. 10]